MKYTNKFILLSQLLLCLSFSALATPNSQNLVPASNIKEAKLRITNHQFKEYCVALKVENPSITPEELVSEGSYLFLENCNNAGVLWSYDVNGRISTIENGLDYCITLPEKELKGKGSWDYLRIKRCDMGNKNQQWFVKTTKGLKYFVSAVGDYKIKDTNNYLYVSNDHAAPYDLTLATSMDGWLKNISKPRSYNFSTGLRWLYQGYFYYANYRADSYFALKETLDDSEDVLYSPIKKTLAVQQLNGINESRSYCLESQQKLNDKTWQYSVLSAKCPDIDDKAAIPDKMKWDMVVVDLPQDKNEPARVKFYDHLGNPLRIWKTKSGWGTTYTAPNNAIPDYKNVILTESTDTFYVNRDVALFELFKSANEQKRTQNCPALSQNPSTSSPSISKERIARHLPPGFQMTTAWYDRLRQIANALSGPETAGRCGACFMQTLEIIRELTELRDPTASTDGHYFNPSDPTPSMTQFSQRFPEAFRVQNIIAHSGAAAIQGMADLFYAGAITQDDFIQYRNRFVLGEQEELIEDLLPDIYTRPRSNFVNVTGFDLATRGSINAAVAGLPVGSTVFVRASFRLQNPFQLYSHATPLIHFHDGWVMLETASVGQTPVEQLNHYRGQSPADAVFYYYQNREASLHDIDFSDPVGNFLVITQIDLRRNQSGVTSPAISFGNCTGDGEDGHRGTGAQAEPSVQNLCQYPNGGLGRCFGAASSH